jgi:signal transduction histidine kinase
MVRFPSKNPASERPDELAPPPRLLLRFALYTGIVLAATGLAILWIVDREVATRAERTVESQARVIAEENLRRHLRADDFAAPVSSGRRAVLDDLFRKRILIPGVLGARLVNREGTITYAASHQLIGTRVGYRTELADVFAGGSKRRVTRTVSWRGQRDVKVLQALIPVRMKESPRTIGALELDQDYRAVDVSIDDARTRLGVILLLAFVALYLSLLPILRRVTGQLEARNRRLREHVRERSRLLEGERAARAEAESVQRLLEEQNERLRQLDRMKDEFVSLVSHELRTPLTSIQGYLELLLDNEGDLTDEQRHFLAIVDRNSRRLLDLVGDLLFLAQVDAGRLAMDFDDVDLLTVVDESVEAARPLAAAKGIELTASAQPLPRLCGDRARLAQVLDNLVSNALKFTPSGGRVEVSLGPVDGRAVLEVADTGFGIPEEEQKQLFERFFRSSNAAANAIPGTGLGLTIARANVERHHGQITVDSAEGEGTTVRVEIPIGDAVTAAGDTDSRSREQSRSPNRPRLRPRASAAGTRRTA